MTTRKRKLKKNNYKIDLLILFLIILGIVVTVIYTRNASNLPNAYNKQNITESIVDSNEYYNLYHVFWQRFNTYAALSADYNEDSAVSSTEVMMFKDDLLKKYEFKISKDNDLFILNKFGQIIPPEQMMCYLKKFDIKSEDQSVAIKECQS